MMTHLQYLISWSQSSILVSCSSLVDLVNEDCPQQSVRSSNNGETQSHGLALLILVLDNLDSSILTWSYVTLGGVNLLLDSSWSSLDWSLLLLNKLGSTETINYIVYHLDNVEAVYITWLQCSLAWERWWAWEEAWAFLDS